MAGQILSAAVMAVFAAAAAAGLWRLVRQKPREALYTLAACAPEPKAERRTALAAALFCAALWAVMLAWAAAKCPDLPLGQAMWQYFGANNDSCHYLRLAQYGYGTEDVFEGRHLLIVFFPLYGWLLRPFVFLGDSLWFAGMALSTLLTVCGAVLQYRCVSRILGGYCAAWAVAFQFLTPGSFFFVMPQTEALFYFLSYAFLELMQTYRCAAAGAVGLLAALCRANGVLLAGFAIVTFWLALRGRQKPRPVWALPVLSPFAGFGIYLGINKAVYGSAWQFTVYQRENWHNGLTTIGRAISVLCSEFGYMDDPVRTYTILWGIGVMLAELAVLALACRRLPVPWLMLGLAGYAVANGQAWLISAQRYALGISPLAPAAACAARKDWQKGLAAGALAVLWLIYFAAFLRRDAIY